jgi:linoleoyl-CoA desaturase
MIHNLSSTPKTSQLRFINKNQSLFFSTVKKRVDAYFREKQLPRHGNTVMWFKAAFFLFGILSLYLLLLLGSFSLSIMLLLAILIGMFAAFIGFNVCHDAIHGSFSGNMRVNQALGLVFNVLGANAYVWSISHNVVHHTYTNIAGHDEDIEVAPGLIRLSLEEQMRPFQRYQHLYAFLLYGLASLSWVFRKDFKKFYQDKIGNHDNRQHPRKEVFNLFFFKFVYYILFIVVPLIVLDIAWWQFVIGFVAMHLAEGLTLGLVFQLAHIVEATDLPLPNAEGNIEEAWACHQMRTTANFATKSKLAYFFCGGLNMQIEHHLFPKICHIHYPAISGIVKQTAMEFDLPYHENSTFGSALVSHYKTLKKMGRTAPVAQPALG